MKHARSALGLALALATSLTACTSGSGNDDSGVPDAMPFRDGWVTVVETTFPLGGDAPVTSLQIGGAEFMDNYANRGDIEVLFDLDSENIKIEMRKYAFQADQVEADETFGKLQLWAYVESSNPDKPQNMAEEDDCTKGWQDGCMIRVYYDGLSQPVRTGADLRVHLPRAYRQSIKVQTEDNTQEGNYKLRGDVKIVDLCGSGQIEVENGTVEVRMCAELQEGPTCSAAQVQDCVDKNWDKDCACKDYGSLKIEAPEPWSANVTVDFPNTIWANVIIDGGKGSGDNSCPAVLDNCSGACGPITQSPETPQIAKAEYNYPGDPAIPGVGYIFDIKVHSCEAVPYVDGPDDYDAKAIDSPKDELRGNVKVCTGCLASL